MRIGLCFKEPLMGESIACLLESRRNWSVCFVAASLGEAFDALAEGPVDALLVDTLGVETKAIRQLAALREEGGPAIALLVADAALSSRLERFADGIVSRRVGADDLLAAIDEMMRPRLRKGALPFDLTQREHECAQLVSRGMSNRRIAELTGLREQSVKNVVSLAMRKLGVDNRVQIALRLGGPAAPVAPVARATVSLTASAPLREAVAAE